MYIKMLGQIVYLVNGNGQITGSYAVHQHGMVRMLGWIENPDGTKHNVNMEFIDEDAALLYLKSKGVRIE